MVKRLKLDADDQRQPQPFQQQQQQQLQQPQQQQWVGANGLPSTAENIANHSLGGIGGNHIFQNTAQQSARDSNNPFSAQNVSQLQNSLNSCQQPSHANSQLPTQQQPVSNTLQDIFPSFTSNTNNSLPQLNPSSYDSYRPQQYNQPSSATSQCSSYQMLSNSQSLPQTHLNSSTQDQSNQSSTFTNSAPNLQLPNPPVTSSQQTCASFGGSLALNKLPGGGAFRGFQDIFSDTSLSSSPWPVQKGFTEREAYHHAHPSNVDTVGHTKGAGASIKPITEPTVAQFPQRSSFSGDYGLQVSFPGESPKLVLKEDNGNYHLYTELSHCITTVVSHSAGQSAAMRFLVVYSKDCETTQPVHPCKIHQNPQHPNHLLEVEANSNSPTWVEEPHPSIVVAPSPSSEGKYSVQMKFLCRNSCITRKNLTLICQLEKDGQVVGRQCMELKISACPRRDAGTRRDAKMSKLKGHQDTNAKMFKYNGHQDGDVVDGFRLGPRVPQSINSAEAAPEGSPSLPQANNYAFSSAMEAGRASALSTFMEGKFKELHPEEYGRYKDEFDKKWERNFHS